MSTPIFPLSSFFTDIFLLQQVGVHGFSPSPRLFDPSEDALVDNMYIDFEAVESENENQTDDAQEEEVEEEEEAKEEDADHNFDVEEGPSPHVDSEVEFVGEAVEQPIRNRSSRVSPFLFLVLLLLIHLSLIVDLSILSCSQARLLERLHL